VERLLHVHGRDVHVLAPALGRLGDHEAVAGGVAGQPSHHQVHAGGQTDAPAPDVHDLAVSDEAAQEVGQLRAGGLAEIEPADQLADGDGFAFSGERSEHAVTEWSHG